MLVHSPLRTRHSPLPLPCTYFSPLLLKGASIPRVVQPFLKWAGGKARLLPQFEPLFPAALANGEIETYVEPFVGAGAVFLYIAHRHRIRSAVLLDNNPDLILTWQAVKCRVDALVEALESMRQQYCARDEAGREELFYETREEFNAVRDTVDREALGADAVRRAAQVILLNKTCYNGLFRTNASGEFNVPHGRYRTAAIFDAGNLRDVSRLLDRATIACRDFASCEEYLNARSFVYFDPPYRPLSRTSSFTAYSREDFTDDDQRCLASFFSHLNRTVHPSLMLSNSDPMASDPPDRFFEDLYGQFSIVRVSAGRMINSKAAGRGRIPEIVVRNY